MSVQRVKKNQLKIGITGNIASGKSTAITYLKAKGYRVIDSDEIVKQLWTMPTVIDDLSTMFERNLHESSVKKMFIEDIFKQKDLRDRLEEYVHPKVYSEIERQIETFSGIIFIDIPLLFETHYESRLDAVILITVPRDIQLNRLMKRGLTKEQALLRIEAQMRQEEKIKKTPYVISGTLGFDHFYEALEKEIERIVNEKHPNFYTD